MLQQERSSEAREWRRVRTFLGDVHLLATPAVWESSQPATVLIHGSAGRVSDLFGIGAELPNTIYVGLPGHAVSPLERNGVADWARALEEALGHLDRRLFLVGESLGGLLALALPYPCVAGDPPLRTDNLWPAWFILQLPSASKYKDLLQPIFAPGQDYRPLVRGGDVITGDVPLMPPRSLQAAPCLFEPEIAPGSVRVHRLAGGHTVMRDNPSASIAIIRAAQERAGHRS